MVDVVYSPTQGRVSNVSAEEKLARDAQDFLFRQQFAQQQKENEARRLAQAERSLTAQERMNADNLAAQRDIQGNFTDRTSAARDLQALVGTQAMDLEGVRGGNALKQAQVGIAPQLLALGLEERKYLDSQNTFDKAIDKKAMEIMGLSGASAATGGRARVGQTSSGSTPGPEMDDGPAFDPMAASMDDNSADTIRSNKPQSRFIVAPQSRGQYQFDDKSARDMANMLGQLKGQVSDKGMGEAQAILDNSNRQLAERKAAEAERVKAELLKASIPQGQQLSMPMEGSPQEPLPMPGQSMRLPGLGAAVPTSQAVDPQTKILMDAITRKFGGKTDDMRREEAIAALRSSSNPDEQAMAIKMLVDPTFQPDLSKVGVRKPSEAIAKTMAENAAMAQFTPEAIAKNIDTKELETFLADQNVVFSKADKRKVMGKWEQAVQDLRATGADEATVTKAKEIIKQRLGRSAADATLWGGLLDAMPELTNFVAELQ